MTHRALALVIALTVAGCGGQDPAPRGTIIERCACGTEDLGEVDGSRCESGQARRTLCVGFCPAGQRATLTVCS